MTPRISIALVLILFSGGGIGPRYLGLEKVPAHCLLAQSTELPDAGNPGHQEPAPGANCVHNAKDAAHNCACHRECKQNTDEEGNPVQGAYVQEDPKCRVYCYKDHCHCPVENCD